MNKYCTIRKWRIVTSPKTEWTAIKEVKSKHALKMYNYRNDPYFCMKCVNGHKNNNHRCYHYAVMRELKECIKNRKFIYNNKKLHISKNLFKNLFKILI
jgi:hypothetical protein